MDVSQIQHRKGSLNKENPDVLTTVQLTSWKLHTVKSLKGSIAIVETSGFALFGGSVLCWVHDTFRSYKSYNSMHVHINTCYTSTTQLLTVRTYISQVISLRISWIRIHLSSYVNKNYGTAEHAYFQTANLQICCPKMQNKQLWDSGPQTSHTLWKVKCL